MTTFDQRERDFETRFVHDEELRFKVMARRDTLVGLWAANRMGLDADGAEAYARELLETEFHHDPAASAKPADRLVDKLVADLAAAGRALTADQVRFEIDHLETEARRQILDA